ncbi:alpha amylase family protein [Pararcticibacter amylolyticus]|uniref:S-layer protein n=1 Tax=Pararcticibacter amylolyticus TaxID=2173175 RepID=A0A2U2PKF7_9SPHI|nr:alpha amylase family protein [Pararcticibacter amylolyticus]PWG81752.1 S-layer protein [Pararcticibacter amylolyticus]
MDRKTFLKIAVTTGLWGLYSCKKDEHKAIDWIWDKKSDDEGTEKPRYIWVDAAANFPDYANSKENIARDLKKLKDCGITDVVVDVRPTMGDVLFSTSTVAQVQKLDVWSDSGYNFHERTVTWDYLQAFIDSGHALGLKIHAAINVFTGGNAYSYGLGSQGMLFREESRKAWATTLNLQSGLTNVLDLTSEQDPSNSYGTKFLNPSNDDVRAFLLNLIGDLAKYNVDGIFLDRCRFNDFQTDFSETSKRKFEQYIGETVNNFPNDVIIPGTSYSQLPSTPPKYFKKWLEFRAKTIHDFMVDARQKVKSVNSKIQFGVYVGGWYSTYYDVGVNWASPKYNTAQYYPAWASPEYRNFGYADHLDFMLIGAYGAVDRIYGSGEWSVQGFCSTAKNVTMGDVKVAGGPDVGNAPGWENGNQGAAVASTVDAAINACDGYFIFDLVHVKKFGYWDALKTGIDKYLAAIKK